MTHKEEMIDWAYSPDGTKIWAKAKHNGWILLDHCQWHKSSVYVVDNEFADYKKALIDGMEIEYRYRSSTEWANYTPIIGFEDSKLYRIKVLYEYQWIWQLDNGNFDITFAFHADIEELRKYTTIKIAERYDPSRRIRST